MHTQEHCHQINYNRYRLTLFWRYPDLKRTCIPYLESVLRVSGELLTGRCTANPDGAR